MTGERQQSRNHRWDVMRMLAAASGLLLGLRFTPEWLLDVPLLAVLPSMVLAGGLIILVEVTEAVFISRRGAETPEEQLKEMSGFLIIALPFIVALGIVSDVKTRVNEVLSRV